MRSKEKIWFITGVSGGFGRALANEAALAGDIVTGTVRKEEQVEPFNQTHPGKTFACLMDITRADEIHKAINMVLQKFGRIDVLVNNAGYGLLGAIEEVSIEEARLQMETNFFGALQVTQAVLPVMRKQQSGHILQISSSAGFRSLAGFGLYNASKFALEGFSEALALETAPLNIKVTIVEPGPFRTSFAGGSSKTAAKEISAYKTTSGAFKVIMEQRNGKQEGDPIKAAKAILQVVDAANPPLRLVLGRFAFEAMKTKIASVEKDMKNWELVGMNTSFDQ